MFVRSAFGRGVLFRTFVAHRMFLNVARHSTRAVRAQHGPKTPKQIRAVGCPAVPQWIAHVAPDFLAAPVCLSRTRSKNVARHEIDNRKHTRCVYNYCLSIGPDIRY